jgi:zinc protease
MIRTRCGRASPALAGLVAAVALADPPPVQVARLENGLEVVVAESHSVPLATVEVVIRGGSMGEGTDSNGFAHLHQRLVNAAAGLGAEMEGATTSELVRWSVTTSPENLQATMPLLRDAVVTAHIEPRELERERARAIDEIERTDADPELRFQRALSQRLWWMFPTFKDPLGRKEAIQAATEHKLKALRERLYVPNNAALVVTGDVRAQEIFTRARALFSSWKAGGDPVRGSPPVRHPALVKSEVLVAQQPVDGVRGQLAWHGPSTIASDVDSPSATYAADLAAHALLEPSSKLQKAALSPGACARVDAAWSPHTNVGSFSLSFEAAPDNVDACLKAVLGEVARMKSPDYLTEAELRAGMRRLEVDRARGRERPSELARLLSEAWASTGLRFYLDYEQYAQKVTRKETASFLGTYVSGQPFVMGVSVSPVMASDPGLDGRHFEELIESLGTGPAAPGRGQAPR